MNDTASSDTRVSSAPTRKSDKPSIGRQKSVSKVDPLDENFEHTLRRAAREKEKQRAKSPGLYL